MKTPRFLGIREIITAIPVLLTIAAAGYVIYRHRVIPFQETDLLVWILALLGLLALGEMVQRYTSLILIERKLSSLSSSSEKVLTGHLADMFLKDRSQFPPFAERVGNAKEIWLFGTSLEAMVAYHSGVFVKKLKESASLRFLLMDPQSPSVDARAHGLFSASKPEILRGDIERTIARIRQMKHACGSCSVSVRLTSFVPSHALVLIDPNSREGIIIVELYPYLITSSDRPHFELTRADTKWYGFFLDQYESIWREAKEHALDEQNP